MLISFLFRVAAGAFFYIKLYRRKRKKSNLKRILKIKATMAASEGGATPGGGEPGGLEGSSVDGIDDPPQTWELQASPVQVFTVASDSAEHAMVSRCDQSAACHHAAVARAASATTATTTMHGRHHCHHHSFNRFLTAFFECAGRSTPLSSET